MKAVRFHPDAESEMIAAAVYYEAQQPDRFVIMAVMHLHRDPDYWKSR